MAIEGKNDKMSKRVHVLVSGKVQGVFFRAFVNEHAVEFGLKGLVRNSGDNVEAVFEGDEEEINKMIKLCKQGPPFARVVKVEVKEEVYKCEFSEFRVVY